MKNDLFDYVEQNKKRYLKELFGLLSIPSISTLPQYKKDIWRAAEWTKAAMAQAGLSAKIYKTEGNPLVFGERKANPQAPTVLFYGHYDVQPPDPLKEWKSDPFKPVIRNGKIFARGATDNKGQFFAHLKAIEVYVKNGKLPINVKFIVEGEEELGSPNISKFVYKNKELLACDVVVVSDGPMPKKNVPSLAYSLRGMVYTGVKTSLAHESVKIVNHEQEESLYKPFPYFRETNQAYCQAFRPRP